MTDNLDKLIAGAGSEVRTSKVEQQLHTEPCGKCRGTGRFVGYTGKVLGECFACKGAGKFTFKQSAEQRAKNRTSTEARKQKIADESVEAFKAAHPAIWAWIEATPNFEFAVAMGDAVRKYGSLTEKQIASSQKCIDRKKAHEVERAANVASAPAVDTAGIDRLKLAFDKARAFAAAKAPGLTLRNPKITIGGITISPAKATSKNAGALYVKDGSVYLGKIADGKFFAANSNGDDIAGKVQAFIADPAEAAKVYGQETGICCVCNATLKSKWRLRGIGPICAQKFGW